MIPRIVIIKNNLAETKKKTKNNKIYELEKCRKCIKMYINCHRIEKKLMQIVNI